MIIYTDSTACADRFLTTDKIQWQKTSISDDNPVSPLIDKILKTKEVFRSEISSVNDWGYLLIAKTASESQYDILIDMGRNNMPLPHGILCLAGQGLKFHGFRGRRWDSPEGNIYLSAYFAPDMPIVNYGAGFMVLAAVSVVDAILEIPEMSVKPAIKWVNDILVEGAKVCGVLAHTMAEAEKVTNAVIGIGLNIETTPEIEPTVFVPRAASLNDFVTGEKSVTRAALFQILTRSIYKNYLTLAAGGYEKLLARYCDYSCVVGREAVVYDDSANEPHTIIAEGPIQSIGQNLELYFAGRKEPVKRGRLALKNPD